MAERNWVVILVAVIGAVATIAAAWITRTSQPVADSSKTGSVEERQSDASEGESLQLTTHEGEGSKVKEHYETVTTVFEGKQAFVDPETGLVFAVEDVHDWKLPSLTGATCRYSLPNGKWLRRGEREVGHREEFRYKDRDFIMVIENIDYERNSVTIRIREM